MFSSVCMQNSSADRVGAVWQNEKKKSADGNWASRCAELIWTRAYRLKDVISRWILSILLCKILVSFFLQVSFNILKCSFHIVRLWFDIFLCFRLWFSFSDFHEIIFIKIIIQIRILLKKWPVVGHHIISLVWGGCCVTSCFQSWPQEHFTLYFHSHTLLLSLWGSNWKWQKDGDYLLNSVLFCSYFLLVLKQIL